MTEAKTAPPDDVVLSATNLSVVFDLRTGPMRAVRNVSFTLRRGRTFCLVGESGSGKSVTARSLMQIVDEPGHITGGQVMLNHDGQSIDITALRADSGEMRAIRGARIGLIFQEPMSALSPLHTIGNQLGEVSQLHLHLDKRAARERSIELLRQVDIHDPEKMIDRYSFEYSGGMRQRVCIAMALACNPDVLIADEPTTALDVTTQAEILDLIKRLQVSHGMAVLLITHDMGIVAEVGDDVAVMQAGEIVETGTVDEIFHAAQHPYTQRLLDATRRLERQSEKRATAAATRGDKPILSVRDLSKSFGATKGLFGSTPGVLAVDSVDLDLFPGENLGIVGESGSGKTTLGRLILRVIEPSGGSIVYRQADTTEVDVRGLDRSGLRRYHADARLVFQDPFASLNPRWTVRKIVGDPLYVKGLARGRALDEKVAELLSLVGLDPATMERYPHAFSGGQRQRIGIARALAVNPRIIIADEATSALDVSIRSQILDLLLDIQQRLKVSFIFISHDISVVRYFCDRVAVMHKGRVVEIGEAEKICSTPDAPYTQSLISAVPSPDPRNKRMLNRVRFVDNTALN